MHHGDAPCTFTNSHATHLCLIYRRFFVHSGSPVITGHSSLYTDVAPWLHHGTHGIAYRKCSNESQAHSDHPGSAYPVGARVRRPGHGDKGISSASAALRLNELLLSVPKRPGSATKLPNRASWKSQAKAGSRHCGKPFRQGSERGGYSRWSKGRTSERRD